MRPNRTEQIIRGFTESDNLLATLGTRPRRLARALAAGVGVLGLLMLPARVALRGYGPGAVDAIVSLDDAVSVCRRSGLHGWSLVTLAQQIVYRKFTHYSCRNLWDTPGQAFGRGMGYCTQYNLALKQILERLGFAPRAVFSIKVRVADDPAWSMGHTWLRLPYEGEIRDVCAGHAANRPGVVQFTPVAPVLPGNDAIFLLTHLGMILFCGLLEWRALITRRPVPAWMFCDRRTG